VEEVAVELLVDYLNNSNILVSLEDQVDLLSDFLHRPSHLSLREDSADETVYYYRTKFGVKLQEIPVNLVADYFHTIIV
jgi:hypothetical protein